jgi:hypothetical protein
VKHIAAGFANGILAFDPGDPLGCTVEGGDPPLKVHREDALVDRIEDYILLVDNRLVVHVASLEENMLFVRNAKNNRVQHCIMQFNCQLDFIRPTV